MNESLRWKGSDSEVCRKMSPTNLIGFNRDGPSHACMNAAMVGVGACGGKSLGKFASRCHITTIKTIVISRYRMRHSIIICPGNRGTRTHSQVCRRKTHVYNAHSIGSTRRRCIIVTGTITTTLATGTYNYCGNHQNQDARKKLFIIHKTLFYWVRHNRNNGCVLILVTDLQ